MTKSVVALFLLQSWEKFTMMDAMTTNEVRQKFLEFFREKGHAVIPSASLIPDDKTVLFVTAGMQPLVPYLMGEKKHPQGARLANSQKCLRTDDILQLVAGGPVRTGRYRPGGLFQERIHRMEFRAFNFKKVVRHRPRKTVCD